jgi:hypothetical protein
MLHSMILLFYGRSDCLEFSRYFWRATPPVLHEKNLKTDTHVMRHDANKICCTFGTAYDPGGWCMLLRSVVKGLGKKKTPRMAFQVGVCWEEGGGSLEGVPEGCGIAGSETIGPVGPNHRSETAGAHTTETIPPAPRPPRPNPAGRLPGAIPLVPRSEGKTLETHSSAQNLQQDDRLCG